MVHAFKHIASRFAQRVGITVFKSPCVASSATHPAGLRLFRAGLLAGEEDRARIEVAMRRALEPRNLATERLTQGDEFFGWVEAEQIICFGWVTHGPHRVGAARMAQRSDRAFLFNFHTVPSRRRQGLYRALLSAICAELARDDIAEAIIDVNDRNLASLGAVRKTGFRPIGRTEHWLLFRRWQVPTGQAVFDAASEPLFVGP
jgi:ribosomal protein S18 acetylase RimI-like enzyme